MSQGQILRGPGCLNRLAWPAPPTTTQSSPRPSYVLLLPIEPAASCPTCHRASRRPALHRDPTSNCAMRRTVHHTTPHRSITLGLKEESSESSKPKNKNLNLIWERTEALIAHWIGGYQDLPYVYASPSLYKMSFAGHIDPFFAHPMSSRPSRSPPSRFTMPQPHPSDRWGRGDTDAIIGRRIGAEGAPHWTRDHARVPWVCLLISSSHPPSPTPARTSVRIPVLRRSRRWRPHGKWATEASARLNSVNLTLAPPRVTHRLPPSVVAPSRSFVHGWTV
jgi:hypothetical protein